jgi:beta-ribofuranosylaminobenzene 5'-phosphate synthase
MMSTMPDSIVVTTGARLHFGFFAHRATGATAGQDASASHLLERTNYGGIGLMIDSPAFVIAASKSDRDHVELADRTETNSSDAARVVATVATLTARYRTACPVDRPPPPCSLQIGGTIPSHCGLGSGTQLALAIAQALALLAGDGQADAPTLALRVGRGRRSAIGIHGFATGGFLVDGGKRREDEVGSLVARANVPNEWRMLLVAPAGSSEWGRGLSGQEELNAFERLPGMPAALTERLCRLVLLEMLPALGRCDYEWFAEALGHFGQSVGDYFRPVQGGRYADPRMAQLVEWLRSLGIHGIAQTSWGPTIAVCCQTAAGADALQAQILANERWDNCHTQIAGPLNTGAKLQDKG